LIGALEDYGFSAKDEAEAWTASGGTIEAVEGDPMNFKITEGSDWSMAEALAEGAAGDRRAGHGYDVHSLVPGRPLILGGVRIDFPLGLLGHSDADVLCHAVSDALLGAAGEPDLGTLFPASDSLYAGADSGALLVRVVERVRRAGWRIVWVDATLVAQIPRLGAYVPRIRESLEGFLRGEGPRRVANLKVKSGEYCGSAGRGECMICHVVATLERGAEVPRS
jgi:2-C-methyl-D-erythritol 4-phosphate cytidylyltransferase/2-C-methyl-D-erythritol 2,4-cyclodiphosphate synthase